MTTFRGADAVASALRAADVHRVFTVSGNHVMSLFDAALSAGIDLIHARHEAAAVHMADAWSRLTGKVGVALVTAGPGHANALSALYTARMAEAPVLLISGHAPSSELEMGSFQEMRQAEMAMPVSKSSWTCRPGEALGAAVRDAMRRSLSGRPGPVQVNIPSDVLEASAAMEAPGEPSDEGRGLMLGQDADLIVQRLRQARCPLILVGPQGMTPHGRMKMRELEETTGVPVIGMESPRGIWDPSLGALAELLPEVDLVLLVAKRVDFTLRFGRQPTFAPHCTFLQIDAEHVELDRSGRTLGPRLELAASAELLHAVPELIDSARRSSPSRTSWREEVRSAVDFRPAAWESAASTAADRLHPVQALRPVQALFDRHPDAVFVSDGGEFGQWAQACLNAPDRLINGVAGAIGSALPYAAAARLATDAPVVVALGDGTFGFHASEIDTAVRYRLPFVAVIGNDARWNAEHQIQLRQYGPDRLVGCDLLPTRYDDVCRGFGGYGESVAAAHEMPAALERAQSSGLPACINVMIEGLPAPQIRRNGN